MNERNFVLKIVRQAEEEFGGICFSYKDGNATKTHEWWNVCIDDYELYFSNKFKAWASRWRDKGKEQSVNLLFCYCNPLESKLAKLAEEDNLIMNL